MSEEYVTRKELQMHLDGCEEASKETADRLTDLDDKVTDLDEKFNGLLEGMPAKDGRPALLGYRELSGIVSSGIKTARWIKYVLGAILLSVIGAFSFYIIETKFLESVEIDEAETLHKILDELRKQQKY